MGKKDIILSKLVAHFRSQGDVILLESQMEGHPESRYSYLAARPLEVLRVKGDQVSYGTEGRKWEECHHPWEALQQFREKHKEWTFGYLGYDLKNDLEKLSSANEQLVDAPDLFFLVPGFLCRISPEGDTEVLKGEMPDLKDQDEPGHYWEMELRSRTEKDRYLDKVRQAQEHISEGDYYEVNISHPLVYDFKGESWALFQQMKETGPVPFAAYLTCGNTEVCSASPERFLARTGTRVWSQPIKGTIRRDEGKEQERINQLLSSEKEKAENLMIVDLVRNDLSRIASRGSVRVRDLFEIQSFRTVHQMVSTVECEVDAQADPVNILKACFPMGSMTGAPKIAAMKAIEELEDYRRGIYSGAIGYISPQGDFDFNVVIRSAIIEGSKLVYPVGGAITSDSDPEQEWEETLVKARALTEAENKFPLSE